MPSTKSHSNTRNEYLTLKPSARWAALSDRDQFRLVCATINKHQRFADSISLLKCEVNGGVIVRLKSNPPTRERGQLLLDLEDCLKAECDEGLVVWAETSADKSALRKLRGIEVRS